MRPSIGRLVCKGLIFVTKPASQREADARVVADAVRAIFGASLATQLVFLAPLAALTLLFWKQTGPWAGLATSLIYLAGVAGLHSLRQAYEIGRAHV